MRGFGRQAHRLRVVLIGALISSTLLLGEPVRGGGISGGPYMRADTSGQAGCSGQPPLGPDDCRSWSRSLASGEANTWDVEESVGLTVGGGSMAATASIHAVEQDNPDGTLGSLQLSATLEGTLTGGGQGDSRLDFTADFPIAGESISVIGQVQAEGHGTALIGGSGDVQVTVGCAEEPAIDLTVNVLGGAHGGEAGRLNDDAKSESINQTVTAVQQSSGRFCSVRVFMNANANTNQGGIATDGGSGKTTVTLTILASGDSPSPSPALGDCALQGAVLDGIDVLDEHANPIPGAAVALLRDGGEVGPGTVSDRQGFYCLPWDGVAVDAAGSPAPGDYHLRLTLTYAFDGTVVMHTQHQEADAPLVVLREVQEAEWGRDDVDVELNGTDARPWLGDAANIHWQSIRYVDWLLDSLALDVTQLGGLRMRVYGTEGTHYQRATLTATIAVADSPYSERDHGASQGPENNEWHEIGHHVGHSLGIANENDHPDCAGRENHAGWANATTCDSLREGFATFVSGLGSLEIDAGRGPGFGTTWYSSMLDLEGNDYAPWTLITASDGERYGREDFAVAQLLWDLADDTPAEEDQIPYLPRSGGSIAIGAVRDRVALGGQTLVRHLFLAHPMTIADLHTALTTNVAIDAALRTPDRDLDGDGTMDLSAIDEVFLLHDFRPLGNGIYQVGSQIGHTPPGGRGQTDRRHVEKLPGAAVRLVNTGAGMATFAVEIGDGDAKQTFEVRVRPGASRDFYLELPPYWEGPLATGEPLPACGAPDQRVLQVAVSGPGADPLRLDSCDYQHRVVEAGDGPALSYTAAGTDAVPPGSPGASGQPGPTAGSTDGVGLVAVLVVAGLALAGLVAFLVVRRRPAA